MSSRLFTPLSPDLAPETLIALEDAVRLVARLDGRISGSFMRQPWMLRAAWSGYAEALRLQGAEIDYIDIFSWGCGVPLPHRPRRTSHLDDMADFAGWVARISQRQPGAWRDALPFAPAPAPDLPLVLRALDVMRHYARIERGAAPWLLLPVALRQLGASETVLPCLVAGAKSFRARPALAPESLRSALRGLATAARRGIALLDGLERDDRHAARALLAERRAGSLTPLVALTRVRPMLSPALVAERLALSLSGAGKLLDRAASLGLVREISGRATWKTYLTPDLATLFSYAPAPRGRPPIAPAPMPDDAGMAALLAAFDRDMAQFDARFGTSGTPGDEEG